MQELYYVIWKFMKRKLLAGAQERITTAAEDGRKLHINKFVRVEMSVRYSLGNIATKAMIRCSLANMRCIICMHGYFPIYTMNA